MKLVVASLSRYLELVRCTGAPNRTHRHIYAALRHSAFWCSVLATPGWISVTLSYSKTCLRCHEEVSITNNHLTIEPSPSAAARRAVGGATGATVGAPWRAAERRPGAIRPRAPECLAESSPTAAEWAAACAASHVGQARLVPFRPARSRLVVHQN